MLNQFFQTFRFFFSPKRKHWNKTENRNKPTRQVIGRHIHFTVKAVDFFIVWGIQRFYGRKQFLEKNLIFECKRIEKSSEDAIIIIIYPRDGAAKRWNNLFGWMEWILLLRGDRIGTGGMSHKKLFVGWYGLSLVFFYCLIILLVQLTMKIIGIWPYAGNPNKRNFMLFLLVIRQVRFCCYFNWAYFQKTCVL